MRGARMARLTVRQLGPDVTASENDIVRFKRSLRHSLLIQFRSTAFL
jgi:hypothetical protein